MTLFNIRLYHVLCSFIVQVFESSRPWYFDISLVKIEITDDKEKYGQCLALQQLHYNVTLAEDIPVGSLVVRIGLQLQQSLCQPQVCTNRLHRKQCKKISLSAKNDKF